MKTINLSLSWADVEVNDSGTLVLEIGAITPGGKSQRVRFKMGPSTIGYIAESLHKAVRLQQSRLEEVKRKLREGE